MSRHILFAVIIFRRLLGCLRQNQIFCFVEIWHGVCGKAHFTCRLDRKIPKLKKCCKQARYGCCYILHARYYEFGRLSVKKPLLLDINNSQIGNNPRVEPIIEPFYKKKKQKRKPPKRQCKYQKRRIVRKEKSCERDYAQCKYKN